MSYEIKQLGIGYAVVREGTNQIVGRHKTRDEAIAQLRALNDTYEIRPADGRHHVVRKGDGVMMGTHATRAAAEAHMLELNASSEPPTTTKASDARKKVIMPGHYDIIRETEGTFEILDWFTGDVVATLTDDNAAHTVIDIMLHNGQLTDAEFNTAERMGLAKKGQAMPDGSFPTPTKAYWFKARQAIGRAKDAAKRSRVISYLKRRATALGIPDNEIPDNWK